MKITKLLFISLLISHFVACQPEEAKDTENKKDKTESTQTSTTQADGQSDKKHPPKKDHAKKNDKKQNAKEAQHKSTRPPEPYKKLNLAQTKEVLAKSTGSVLLDARNAKDYKEGHMDQAENLDYRDKESFNKKLQSMDKNKSYVIYAYKGKRAQRAAKAMAKAGFKNLYVVDADASELLGKSEKSKK